MHILEIVSFLPPYGGYFAVEQAAALQRAGHHVSLLYVQQLSLTLDGSGTWLRGQRSKSHDFDPQSVHIHKRYFRGIPKAVHHNQATYCRLINQMYDHYVERYGTPDILHAQAAKWAGIAAMQISRRTGIPYYVTEHFSSGSYEIDFGKGWTRHIWARHLIRQCYLQAACVIPVAQELIQDTATYFGTDYTTHPISNITDTTFYAYRDRSPRAMRPYRYCCLAIANQQQFYRKGYDTLAQAWSILQHSEDLPLIELHIAGRDTDTHEFSQQFRHHYRQPLDSSIVLHGDLNRQQVRELLYQSDALVLASRSEVQPLVVMEALSTGIPVVGTTTIPQCQRIAGGVLISPIGDAQQLAKHLRDVTHITPSPHFHEAITQLSSADAVAAQLTKLFSSH